MKTHLKRTLSFITALALFIPQGVNVSRTSALAKGDIDGNSIVDMNDLTYLSLYLLKDISLSEAEIAAADMNSDGEVRLNDLAEMKMIIMKAMPEFEWNTSNIPSMDGSSSAVPLETGMKSELLGITYKEAGKLVSHTKTHIAFQNLLDGTTDLILSVPISDEQQAMADEAGVKLEMTPVAKEGFVFVVNADNPVDSLTTEQIKGIYSGKITNWSEVGGNDEPIIPYQRNNDSGSQNYMVKFMGDTKLIKPEKNYIVGTMSAILDYISTYDNSSGAIGYSVYSYAAQIYANANKIKFISVDGIAPTKETMADESYPLSSCTYIITTDKASENTRRFVDWATSDEGQLCVLKNNYLPVNGMEIPDEYKPYDSLGTSGIKKEDGYEQYKLCYRIRSSYNKDLYIYNKEHYEIIFLKDEEFQDKVNADIREMTDKLVKENGIAYHDLDIDIECVNGYMSIIIGIKSSDGFTNNYLCASSLCYDIIEQKKIEKFSELFYEGEAFMPYVNNYITAYIESVTSKHKNSNEKWNSEIKNGFSGILGEPEVFTLYGVCPAKENPYFQNMPLLDFSGDYIKGSCPILKKMVIGKTRDMSDAVNVNISGYTNRPYTTERYLNDGYYCEKATDSIFLDENEMKQLNAEYKKVNEAAIKFITENDDVEYSSELVILLDIPYNSPFNLWNYSFDNEFDLWQVTYCYSTTGAPMYQAFIDAETYEVITPEMLIGENWYEYFPEGCKDKECCLWDVALVRDIDGERSLFIKVKCKEKYREEENQSTVFTGKNIPFSAIDPKYLSIVK